MRTVDGQVNRIGPSKIGKKFRGATRQERRKNLLQKAKGQKG